MIKLNSLVLPTLKINNTLTKRVDHIKFLGILFDENLTWKSHINLIENSIKKPRYLTPWNYNTNRNNM